MDVQTLGIDDDVLAPSLEDEFTVLVDGADVTGVEPSFFAADRGPFPALPVSGGDALPAHQDLAGFRIELELASGEDLADRAPGELERMLHRDERSRLRQAIALDHDVAKPPPELV